MKSETSQCLFVFKSAPDPALEPRAQLIADHALQSCQASLRQLQGALLADLAKHSSLLQCTDACQAFCQSVPFGPKMANISVVFIDTYVQYWQHPCRHVSFAGIAFIYILDILEYHHNLQTGWEPPEAHCSSRQSITALSISYMSTVFSSLCQKPGKP